MSTVLHQDIPTAKQDFLPLNGADYIEFYVGNARQAAYFYRLAMGMRWVAYAGPETGQHDRVSFVLQQGNLHFVLTAPLRPDTEMAEHIHRHGDGVRDVALWVDDARYAWKEATKRGARSVREPFDVEDGDGSVKMASIATYGDTIHTFVERHRYRGPFLPGYAAAPRDFVTRPTGLTHVDHIAGNVGAKEMSRWANFYADILGLDVCQRFRDRDTDVTMDSVLLSKKTANGKGRVSFPIHAPVGGHKHSQVEEYLEGYHGSGVQHIALATTDILYTTAKMREQGVEFLPAPHAYYADLPNRACRIDEPLSDLERLGILVDRDDEGDMLHIFTRPIGDRRTFSFEIVQRKGSGNFGEGDSKAEAAERR